jgi:small subunit ribosomal protein S20
LPKKRADPKRARRQEQRRLRNRSVRTSLKTLNRKASDAIEEGDQGTAQEAVSLACARYDRAARKGVIHTNNAARHKSQLARRFNQAFSTVG